MVINRDTAVFLSYPSKLGSLLTYNKCKLLFQKKKQNLSLTITHMNTYLFNENDRSTFYMVY